MGKTCFTKPIGQWFGQLPQLERPWPSVAGMRPAIREEKDVNFGYCHIRERWLPTYNTWYQYLYLAKKCSFAIFCWNSSFVDLLAPVLNYAMMSFLQYPIKFFEARNYEIHLHMSAPISLKGQKRKMPLLHLHRALPEEWYYTQLLQGPVEIKKGRPPPWSNPHKWFYSFPMMQWEHGCMDVQLMAATDVSVPPCLSFLSGLNPSKSFGNFLFSLNHDVSCAKNGRSSKRKPKLACLTLPWISHQEKMAIPMSPDNITVQLRAFRSKGEANTGKMKTEAALENA